MVGKVRESIRWWVKTSLENIKAVVTVITLFGGLIGVSIDSYGKSDTIEQANAQTAMHAKAYAEVFKSKIVIHQKPSNCGKCIKMITELRREFHGD